ncbi:MAG: D-alanyl-D-alanine carboxypeptidase family protein [Candidatus Magasanikbacteria bacterium]
MIKLEDIKNSRFSRNQSFSVMSLVVIIGFISLGLFSFFSFLLQQNIKQSSRIFAISGIDSVQAEPRKSKPSPDYLEKKQKKEKPVPKLKKGVEVKTDWEAKSVLVKDHKTGKVLLAKNPDAEHPLASITKLMSSLVLLDNGIDWSQIIKVTDKDLPDSLVDSGETYSKSNLWTASLVGSSNKSMYSLVRDLDWPMRAFIQRMNKKAQSLGMNDTYFVGTTGLDKKSVSTAKDISILLREAMRHKKIQKALTTDQVKLKPRNEEEVHHIWNTDWLLLGWIPNKFERVYGGKTGYIDAAGYNFTVQVSDKDGHVVDVVVLGADSHEARFKVARKAARWVFDNYEWPE